MTTVDGRIGQCMVSLFMLIVSAVMWLDEANSAKLSEYLLGGKDMDLPSLLNNPFANELVASVLIFSAYQLLTLFDIWKQRSSIQHTTLVVLWLIASGCFVMLTWVPEGETLMMYMVVYGALFSVRVLGFFNDENLVRAFIIADIASKCVNMNEIRSRNVPIVQSMLNSIKLLRIMSPKLEEARQAGLITTQEMTKITQLLDKRDAGTKELSAAMLSDLIDVQNESLLSGDRFSSAERFVMFVDVVDYTSFVKNNDLSEVVVFMNDLYIKMDLLAVRHKVGKLETVGDSYVVVNSDIVSVLRFGSDVLSKFGSRLRIGVDFGVVADVVLGYEKLGRSCIGHAVNCASRIQSTGDPGKLHVSIRVRDTASRLVAENELGSFVPRAELVLLKGVGEEQTFFFEPASTILRTPSKQLHFEGSS